jgi:hypothetical protein
MRLVSVFLSILASVSPGCGFVAHRQKNGGQHVKIINTNSNYCLQPLKDRDHSQCDSDRGNGRRDFLNSLMVGSTTVCAFPFLKPPAVQALTDETKENKIMSPYGPRNRRIGGITAKIRNIGKVMVSLCNESVLLQDFCGCCFL